MQAVGVFPAGMLVRLRSNRLGVVLDAGRRCGRVRVRAFASTIDGSTFAPLDVAIGETLAEDQVVAEEEPGRWGLDDWSLIAEQIIAGSGHWARGGTPALACNAARAA